MKYLTRDEIDQIRSRSNIVDIISSYIPLEKAGNNFKAVCPFHDDTNPSLSVNQDKQIFKCFACGVGGNVFTFVRDYEEISYIEAVIKVADMVGIDLSDYNLNNYQPKLDDETVQAYKIMDETQKYVEFTLSNTKDEQVKEFLSQRQLTPDLIKTFQLGYIDKQFPLVNYLHKKGYDYQSIEALNLANYHDGNYFDMFNGRILFPIKNHNNQVVAYTARGLGQTQPKYINSATSKIYQKAHILYNYHNAMIRDYKDDAVVLCEGVMDVIAFHKSGHPKTVATLGTALSEQQITLLKKMNSPIVLGYDGDNAGLQAMLTIGSKLREHHLSVSILNNHSGDDPDEITKKQSLQALKEMVDKPKHWLEFILERASALYGLNSYSSKKDIVDFTIKHLSNYDELDQAYFIKQLSLLTGFDESVIKQSIPNKKGNSVKTVKPRIHKVAVSSSMLQSEKLILAYLLDGKKYAQQFKLKLGYLIDENANDLALLFLNLYKVHDTINVADCLSMNLNSIQESVLLEISEDSLYQVPKNEQHFQELMIQIQITDLDNMIESLNKSILKESDSNRKTELIKESTQLLIKRNNLRMEANDEEI